jgi:hypothetical protein
MVAAALVWVEIFLSGRFRDTKRETDQFNRGSGLG